MAWHANNLRRVVRSICTLVVAALATAPVAAAEPGRGDAIADLPRRGYEVGRLRFGNAMLMPVLSAESHYDSNVFATSRRTRDDVVFNLGPRLGISVDGGRLTIDADAEANFRLHSDNTTEDRTTFGAGASAVFLASSRETFDGKVRYDRLAESRADPEANPLLRRPAQLDSVGADFGFGHRTRRFGITLRGGAQKVNYLDAADADRDLTNYQASLRINVPLSPRLDLFVQPYGNRRDARLSVDRSGVDRDVTTTGILAGAAIDITGRWRGEFGAGVFHADPDGALKSFDGLALRGSLYWTPVARTAVTLKASRGDAATIRSGANGRIDTNISLRIDQEARHNLLLHAGVAYEGTSYRGNIDRRLRQFSVDAEAELLVGRRLSVFIRASHTDRDANSRFDQFKRTTAGLGLRLKV